MKRPAVHSTAMDKGEPGRPPDSPGSAQRLVLLAFAAVVAVILGAAHLSFNYFSGRVIQGAQENLLAIARLKSAQIGMLIDQKKRDGRVFSSRPAVQYILRGQLKGKAGLEIERLVASFIADSISISGYRRIFITDTESRLVAPSANGSLEPSERAALQAAVKTRNLALADIHAHSDGEPDFGIAYPVFDGGNPEGRVLGAVYLESSVRKTLFPLLIGWPTSSPSAESSLVRREGDEVVILNPLKQDPAAAPLWIRIPMVEEGRLGTRAIMKGETLIEAYDSRGIQVIAAAYPVPGTPWVMLSKVDREEVQGPVHVLAATIAALVVVLLALSASISWLLLRWRSQSLALERLHLAERYATAARTSIDGYLVLDFHSGAITEANDALVRMTGYTEGELLSLTVADMAADESPQEIAERGKTLAQIGADRFHARWKRKDASVIDVEISMTYLPDSSGGHVHVFVRDITERRRLENEILMLNETLERRVGDRTRELEHANRELDSFSYSVSHDLRAPLRALVGFTGIIQQDYASALDADGRQLLDRIVRNSVRMGEMIDDLLRLSRLGRASLDFQPLDLNALVADAARTAGADYPATQVELAQLPMVTGDRGLLRQVFQNLLSNAFKFSAKVDSPAVSVGIEPAPDGPVFFVRDNGAGFDMQYADKLFGVFQRLHQASDFPGTGVGLVIARRIIERHGGRVWAESAPGAGATFRFTLGRRPEGLRGREAA